MKDDQNKRWVKKNDDEIQHKVNSEDYPRFSYCNCAISNHNILIHIDKYIFCNILM